MTEQAALPPPSPAAHESVPPSPAKRLNPIPMLYLAGFAILAVALIWLWRNPPADHGPRVDPAQIAALQEKVQALEERLAVVERRPVAPPTDLRPLDGRVAALENRPAPPPTNLAPLEQRIAALEQRPQLPGDIATRVDLAGLAARMDAVAARQDQLANRQQGLETGFGNRLDQTDAKVASLEQDAAGLSGLANRVQATDKRLEAVEKQVGQVVGQVPALAEKAGRIGRIQAAQAALDAGRPLGDLPGAPPALLRFAQARPPTEAELRLAFPAAARAAEHASRPAAEDRPFLDRMWLRAQDLVTVREGDRVIIGDPAAGVIARARQALLAGDLAGAVAALDALSGPPAEAMAAWQERAKALLDARSALATLAARA
jgi:hypothetical protein